MVEKIFIADKETQDAIKQSSDLIGSPNPTTPDTTTVMNYLKKIESGMNSSQSNNYVPKMVGSIGIGPYGFFIPYNNSYLTIFYKDSEWLGILPKGGATLIASIASSPYSHHTYNFSNGYAYHVLGSSQVKSINLKTGATKINSSTGLTFTYDSAWLHPLSNGNVLLVTSGTTWKVLTPDLSSVVKTITLDIATSSINYCAFDQKNNTIYFTYADNVMYFGFKSYTLDYYAGTATKFMDTGTMSIQNGGSASVPTMGIYVTDNYAIAYQFAAQQYIVFKRTDSTGKYGSTYWTASSGGIFDGDSDGGYYLAGLKSGTNPFLFYHLGNDKFMVLRRNGGSSDTDPQSGVIARIVDGQIVPIKKIMAVDIPTVQYYYSYANIPKMFLYNQPMQNGRIVVNSVEYDISDQIENT